MYRYGMEPYHVVRRRNGPFVKKEYDQHPELYRFVFSEKYFQIWDGFISGKMSLKLMRSFLTFVLLICTVAI